MDFTVGMLVAAAAVLVAVVALIRVITLIRARRRATRDDLQRAGATHDADARAAADRAAGHNSWMRPDGGGTL
jgi:hypothetical protein